MNPIILAVLLGSVLSASSQDPPDYFWPQWRGPARDGFAISQPWPSSIDKDHLKQVWRLEFGPSYSGPIVYGKRVFTTETVDKKEEVVTALDRETGKELWSVRWKGAIRVPFFAAKNGSWIRSTPACDGERLYVAGIRDVLVCLDVATGKEVWRMDFVKEFGAPVPSFGFVCSPLLDGDYVYVQAGGSFVKLEKKTGKVVWRTLKDGGGMWLSAFSSPALATLNGTRQVLVQTRQKMAGVALDSGDELWFRNIKAFRGMNILTPTVYGDSLFTSAYRGISQRFKPNQTDAVWENRAQGYMSSPLVIGDHLYMHLKNKRFTCIDLKTGKTAWTTEPYGMYWSLVAQGNRILALDERGELFLIKANPEAFELIEQRRISQAPCWAHLAVAGDMIFVRELKALAAYRWK